VYIITVIAIILFLIFSSVAFVIHTHTHIRARVHAPCDFVYFSDPSDTPFDRIEWYRATGRVRQTLQELLRTSSWPGRTVYIFSIRPSTNLLPHQSIECSKLPVSTIITAKYYYLLLGILYYRNELPACSLPRFVLFFALPCVFLIVFKCRVFLSSF